MTIPADIEAKPQRVFWQPFVDEIFRWNQGEHVAFIAPTGSGKTTVALRLLPLRKYITVLATKPRDKTLDAFAQGFGRHKHWLNGWQKGFVVWGQWREHASATKFPHRVIWPPADRLDSAEQQGHVFRDTLSSIYTQGSWCVYIDELWFVTNVLKLDREVKVYLQQARSLDISLVVATQRPAFIPLEVYDQSTHLFFWRDNDEANLSRISGISWLSARLVRETVADLLPHEVLYINTRTGEMYRTMCPEVK